MVYEDQIAVIQWSGSKQIRNDRAEKEKDAYFL